jgi:hypothetical protein
MAMLYTLSALENRPLSIHFQGATFNLAVLPIRYYSRPTFPSHCSRCFRAAHYGVIAAMGHPMGQMTHLPIEALLELRIR